MENIKTVSYGSNKRYAEAMCLYSTADEFLHLMVESLGLVYKTVDVFVRRNNPRRWQSIRNW